MQTPDFISVRVGSDTCAYPAKLHTQSAWLMWARVAINCQYETHGLLPRHYEKDDPVPEDQ
jgi:hypothetical protein